jgi:branched-chain amino acid transport system substrate-binding protein
MANADAWVRAVLTHMSSVYSDIGGSVAAAKLAVKDFGAAVKRIKIDRNCRCRRAKHIASTWLDVDKLDVIVDLPNSGIALVVSEIARRSLRPKRRHRPHRGEMQRQHY